jgi:hypothetical protein
VIIGKILKGANALDTAIEKPTRVELWINICSRPVLRLMIPAALAASGEGHPMTAMTQGAVQGGTCRRRKSPLLTALTTTEI